MGYIGQTPTDVPLDSSDIQDGTIATADFADTAIIGMEGSIGGLTLSNNGTDGDHDIDIATGYARDYGNAKTMILSSALTKQIDATWSVGDDAGGLDTGSVAGSTGYGVYLIRRSDTGVVDALFSTDMSSAGSSVTMPTNYDQKRLIGWVQTNASSNIIAFTQIGDYFRLTGDIFIALTDGTVTASTAETLTLTTPPLCLAILYVTHSNSTATDWNFRTWVRTGGASDDITHGAETFTSVQAGGATGDIDVALGEVLTNSSKEIDYAGTESSGELTIIIRVAGCKMLTRSNPQ